ncbi:type IV pilin protein [Planctobacterium marinum]
MKRITGISLIELLITVAILGIIMSIAIPSYNDSLLTTRRSEAMNELLKLQMTQEGYRLENSSYASSDDITLPSSDYYTYSVGNIGASSYTLTATAKSSQTSDTGCTTLTLDQSANKTPSDCWE